MLIEKGTDSFLLWLADQHERARPEYARVRPKYYYYYEWMRKRLGERFPEGLPEPVVDKLLALDAGELDLLLQYPQAIAGQAAEFVQVLEAQGADALATYRSPTLSWEEVKALKAAMDMTPGAVKERSLWSVIDHDLPKQGDASQENYWIIRFTLFE